MSKDTKVPVTQGETLERKQEFASKDSSMSDANHVFVKHQGDEFDEAIDAIDECAISSIICELASDHFNNMSSLQLCSDRILSANLISGAEVR